MHGQCLVTMRNVWNMSDKCLVTMENMWSLWKMDGKCRDLWETNGTYKYDNGDIETNLWQCIIIPC